MSQGKRPPSLTAVIVGDDKASQIYVGNKLKAAEKCGLRADTIQRGSSLSQEELLELIDSLRRDDGVGNNVAFSSLRHSSQSSFPPLPSSPLPPLPPQVDGILVQLPLPSHIHEKTICNALPPDKDVDAFHIDNIGI